MQCPKCGAYHEAAAHFCGCCGAPLSEPENTGSHLVPLLMLGAMSICGIVLFFLLG